MDPNFIRQRVVFSGDWVPFDEDTEDVLIQVMEAYGSASSKTLERMTHKDKPWIEARGNLSPEERCNNIISKESVKAYFAKKYGDQLNG